ncbi:MULTISPECIES: AMP-binding protein [Gammaproteobacteria]|uniref:AMP-binding protein n=1 Tax=Gammaproteobacteria TaxID=1236 RepID=UPI000DD0DE11|nr:MULTISPECIES: AMP-binding protein [Gammaproteobacteria]RTE85535.1 long-chain fatty acid--CoA ligase [Aliidiomarina sp. B3213]TCZ89504.1 long-chain fatty acid--CoA ligase [Lysobacter sp. N42]
MPVDQPFNNLSSYLESCFSAHGDKVAYQCIGQSVDYHYIDQKSEDLARYFQHELGLAAGDRIVIQLPNIIQYPIATYAALRAGLVVVNTNPLYTTREMLHQFNDSGARAIVILSDLYPKLEQVKADTQIEHVVVTGAADLLKGSTDLIEGTNGFVQALDAGSALPELKANTAQVDDIAVLQYTGGTTGVAKGAMLTHGNLLSNSAQMKARIVERSTSGTFVCPLPLYHIYAFTVNMLGLFGIGIANHLIPNPRDIDGFVKSIKETEFTGIAGINTLFVGLCQHPEFRAMDFSSLKITFSGGAALTHSAADLWKEVTGCTVTEGWGLSETSPVATLNEFDHEEIGTVGTPMDDTEVLAWDEDNQPLAVGEPGELVVKGPQVMKGYWNRPDETEKVLINGWFKTGDVGLVQENGNIKIVDRLKDMIIVSGFNVYPNEIEDVLCQHPAVLEAAVVGKPSDKTGESVHAFVSLKGETTESELIEYCREQLTNYKVPQSVTIMDELPKSTVGKILRRELR